MIILDKENPKYIENDFFTEKELIYQLNNNPFAKYILYQKESKIVGYIYYSEIYDKLEINQIEVLPIYRKQNIGTTMLNYLINLNKDITLEVKESNYPALLLYEKVGFKKLAIRKKYYGNEEGILMGILKS